MYLWLWIKAVGKVWWALMSCAIFTIIGLVAAYKNENNQWTVNAIFGAAGLSLLVACYLAWEKEHVSLIKCQSLLEERLPSLMVGVGDLIVVPGHNSAEVFVDASISNSTPSTRAAVREIVIELEISGKRFKTNRTIENLADYYLIERRDIHLSIITAHRFTPMKDLAKSVSGDKPIEYGVHHRGWLHFHLRDLPDWPPTANRLLHFSPRPTEGNISAQSTVWGDWIETDAMEASLDSVQLSLLHVHGYVGVDMTFFASVNKTGERLIIPRNW